MSTWRVIALLLTSACLLRESIGEEDASHPQPQPPPPLENGSGGRRCFSTDEVRCLVHQNCTDGLHETVPPTAVPLSFGRLRFPGTASSDEMGVFRTYEELNPRFANLGLEAGCQPDAALCFDAGETSTVVDLSLAFRPLDDLGQGHGHNAFDVVLKRVEQRASEALSQLSSSASGGALSAEELRRAEAYQRVLLTTLRDPGSYATKWYRLRESWDQATDLSNYTFEEWIERTPWRMNSLTRNLAAEPDRRSTNQGMLQTRPGVLNTRGLDVETFVEDAHMIEQNDLGPEKSAVYRLALKRLQEDFSHFGIFHRLLDSWELLFHTFCWEVEVDKKHYSEANKKGAEAIQSFSEVRKLGIDAEKAWEMLLERNRLDVALMEEAERLMDERLERVRLERASGVLCNFLGRVKVTCGMKSGGSGEEL